MTERESIIEKVRALLALADRSRNDNINEAMAAEQVARRLVEEHRLRQFELRQDGAGREPPPPFTRRDLMGQLGGRRVTDWRFHLAVDVAESHRCVAVCVPAQDGERGRLEIFGRPDDLDVVAYTFFHLEREVERHVRGLGRTCRKRLPAARRRWFRDLRLGVVESLGKRVLSRRTAEERKLGKQPGRGTRYLAHLDRERQALDRFVREVHPDMEDPGTFEADDAAFATGVKHGRGIDLGNRRARRLSPGTRLLPKEAAG